MRSGQMFRVTHPHSAYLEVFMDMGLLGTALVCGYFVKVWKGFRAFSSDPALSPELRGFFQGAAAGLIALAIANIAGSTLYPAVEQVYLWMAIGVMYGLRLRRPARPTQAR
jgi:O-antigen ligase